MRHDFVTIADLPKEKLMYLLEMAKEFENHPNRELLKGKVVATLFFEPSTRTRLSFETAANRLGARVIGFSDAKASSVTKGETLKDTILMVSNYADVIVMRHYVEGAAQYASEVVRFLLSMQAMVHTCTRHSVSSIFIPSTKHKALSKTLISISLAT